MIFFLYLCILIFLCIFVYELVRLMVSQSTYHYVNISLIIHKLNFFQVIMWPLSSPKSILKLYQLPLFSLFRKNLSLCWSYSRFQLSMDLLGCWFNNLGLSKVSVVQCICTYLYFVWSFRTPVNNDFWWNLIHGRLRHTIIGLRVYLSIYHYIDCSLEIYFCAY